MEELAEIVNENGDCFVDGFTIGREGYGSIHFPGVVNVAGLNLDEIGKTFYYILIISIFIRMTRIIRSISDIDLIILVERKKILIIFLSIISQF